MLTRSRLWNQMPGQGVVVNRANSIGSSLVGLINCTDAPREIVTGRRITVDTSTVLTSTAQGRARVVSGSVGIYTGRREWADWEPTSQPFSLIAYWYLTAYAAVAAINIGDTSGSNGYSFNERFGVGTRRYNAGGIFLDPASSPVWPLNTPILGVLTYDGSTLHGYTNGVDDGSASGGGNCTYDTFCRVSAGHSPDTGSLTGAVYYVGMCNRVLSYGEALSLYQQPFQIFRAPPTRVFMLATAIAADELFAQACL